MGVADPDDACARWWDGTLATALPAPFPWVLSGLAALRTSGAATWSQPAARSTSASACWSRVDTRP
jgi:hypothetical protein